MNPFAGSIIYKRLRFNLNYSGIGPNLHVGHGLGLDLVLVLVILNIVEIT